MPKRSYSGSGTYDAPVSRGVAVTPHDVNPLASTTRAFYVGGAGNVACRFEGSTADTTLTGLLVGTVYPFALTHIRATGTTATNIIALD